MQKKHKHILVPGRRYQDSRHVLQNQKVPKNVMGFNNHAKRSFYLDVENPLSFYGNMLVSPQKFLFGLIAGINIKKSNNICQI